MSTPTQSPPRDRAQSEVFWKCVVRRKLDGGVEYRCKLGLWSVWSAGAATAEREARHYWIQYLHSGEYDKLLSTGTP